MPHISKSVTLLNCHHCDFQIILERELRAKEAFERAERIKDGWRMGAMNAEATEGSTGDGGKKGKGGKRKRKAGGTKEGRVQREEGTPEEEEEGEGDDDEEARAAKVDALFGDDDDDEDDEQMVGRFPFQYYFSLRLEEFMWFWGVSCSLL